MKRKQLLFALMVCGLLSFFKQNSYATIYYVTVTGDGSMDGSSWTNAFPGTFLQGAINGSVGGDEVWVACGIYYPTTGNDRTISFSMKDSVGIYGSFAGGETNISQRHLTCGPCSILSGNINTPSNTDNSYKVMVNYSLNYLSQSSILDGFIIRDGYDERPVFIDNNSLVPPPYEGCGAGILNRGNSSDSSFVPIFCYPVIRNCVITQNSCTYGAGIFNQSDIGQVLPTIINSVIANNTAFHSGGGIYDYGLGNSSVIDIYNCLIVDNIAGHAAGAIYSNGGHDGSSFVNIYNSTIANNSVIYGVGGAFVADRSTGYGGGSGIAILSLENSILVNNMADTCPQFYVYEPDSISSAGIGAYYCNVDTTGQFPPHVLLGPYLNDSNIFNNDPQFINVANSIGPDGCWMTYDDGLRLQSTSPCIDSGDSSLVISILELDLLFNPRVAGSNVDMGAYEFSPGKANGIENIEFEINLYPNPIVDHLIIETNTELHCDLYNFLGEILITFNLSSGYKQIDVSNLPTGIYYLNLTNGNALQKCKKLVKY